MRFPAIVQRKTESKVPDYAKALGVGGDPEESEKFSIELRFDAGTYTVVTLPVSRAAFDSLSVGQRITLEARA